MIDWLRDLWIRILFVFKPTYRVFGSIQDALNALPARGGTILVGPGEFFVGKEGVQLPAKDVRIIGGVYRMLAGSPGFTMKPTGKRAIFIECTFVGNGEGPVFTAESES